MVDKPSLPLQAVAALIAATALWSGNFVVGRALGGDISPLTLNWTRWLIAGLVLLPVLALHRKTIFSGLRTHLLHIVALAALGIVAFNWLLYIALLNVSASISALTVNISPILIIGLSALLFGQKLQFLQVVGALLAFCGVALALFGGAQSGGFSLTGSGLAYLFSAALSWAFYTLFLREWRLPFPPLVTLALSVWMGLVIMAPFAVWSGVATTWPASNWSEVLALLYLGIGASLAAFFAWQFGVREIGAAKAGVFLPLIPVFTVILAILLLDEQLNWSKLTGLGLVLLGIIIVQRSR